MEDNNVSNQAPNQGQNVNQQFNNQFGQMPIPNSAAVLVLGMLSIVLGFCYGFIGLVLGIIAIVLAGKANAIYNANPTNFTVSSFNNLKAGKICAIIGTILSALMLVYIIVVFFIVGAAMTGLPWSQMMKGH